MKKIFFLFAMLTSVAASAQVTNVEPTGANYTNKTVSFRVWWNAGSRDATHLSKVWVWVDYITVNSNNTTSGNAWTRALVSGTPTTTAGTVALETENDKGFWLTGNASTNYSATVTVKLDVTASKFNWCVYGSDYPPNAYITGGDYTNGTYTLKGTRPFLINGAITVDVDTYSGGNITSITDATQCPGIRCSLRDEAVADGCCLGLIATSSYCRDLTADAASTYSCNGVIFEVKNTPGNYTSWSNANSACTGIGWRLSTAVENGCLTSAGRIIATNCGSNGTWQAWDWWVSDGSNCRGNGSVNCDGCLKCTCNSSNAKYVCVRD